MMDMLQKRTRIWGALAYASVLESVRRKDLYVAVILSVLMIVTAATMGTFGVQGLEVFLTDAALTVVNLVSMLVAILFAARQLPEEISRRTVYPLLARPLSRGDLIFGKWLGAFVLSALALVLFCLVAVGALLFYRIPIGAIFWQYFLLRLFSLAVLCAMTILLSLLITPSATVTIACLLAISSSMFSQFINMMQGTAGQVFGAFLRGAYFVVPRLDLFDLSKKVSYGWKPVEAWVIRDLFLLAVTYISVLLLLSMIRFRRMAV
jgi:ABC-type transport system involved in multi-copper enzyme maturation permease subunit